MDRAVLVELPKAELHVHLELSIRPGTAEELAHARGVGAPSRGPWPDQATFVRDCEQVRDLVRTRDDLARVAEELVHAADRQGIWWTEVTCAPYNYEGRLGPVEDVLRAVLAGLSAGCAATGRGAGVVLAHNRAHDRARAWSLLELCDAHRPAGEGSVGVVALGLVGDERAFPPHQFRELFSAALERGVNRVPHAGEADGPAAIRTAWTELHAQRIAHGARAAESPALVADLAETGTCLDLCPSSNVALHASPSLRDHQLPVLLRGGVNVSVGSDCTYLMGVDLVDEYVHLLTEMNLSSEEVATIARTSLVESFAPRPLVARALDALDAWRAEAGLAAANDPVTTASVRTT